MGSVLTNHGMTDEEICDVAGVELAVTEKDFQGIPENGKYDLDHDPVSRFGGGNRAKKARGIIEKLKGFFEKYFGLGIAELKAEQQEQATVYEFETDYQMAADEPAPYDKQ